jgi:hypothetical protein
MRHILAACTAGFLASACTTPATETADAKPDARQGKQVERICFNQQIRHWRENGNKSVILEKNDREEFKVDLIGACQVDDAFLNIGLISRIGGGTCLEEGDQLVTDSRFGGSCSIHRIYEWHKDATTVAENATN